MFTTEQILGVHFFNGTVEEAVDVMSTNGGLLVVPAAPALVKVQSGEGYRRALVSADMAIADSGVMVLLWKVFSGRRVERIFGLKFLKRVIARLRSVNLTANSDFYVAPRYGPDVRDDALVAKIDSHPPAHVVVGIGGGVQEKLVLAFLTGDQPPIPMWADRFYLGWLLRLLRQPRVFGPRYLSALKLPALVFRYRENLPPLAKS